MARVGQHGAEKSVGNGPKTTTKLPCLLAEAGRQRGHRLVVGVLLEVAVPGVVLTLVGERLAAERPHADLPQEPKDLRSACCFVVLLCCCVVVLLVGISACNTNSKTSIDIEKERKRRASCLFNRHHIVVVV